MTSPRILVPLTVATAHEINAAVQRARAQAALIQARYTYADRCLRCSGSRAPHRVYCDTCQALIERIIALPPTPRCASCGDVSYLRLCAACQEAELPDVPNVAPVSVPPVGWGHEGWQE